MYPFYTTMDGNPTVWLCFYGTIRLGKRIVGQID
jgi:hypothetical protein